MRPETRGFKTQPVDVYGDTLTVTAKTTTIGSNAYGWGEVVGGLLTFPGAFREAGAGGTIRSLVIVDNIVQGSPLDLWLFDSPVTPSADHTPFHITDADAARCVGIISTGSNTTYATASNSVQVEEVSRSVAGVSTSLYGVIVAKGTPTYNAVDALTVRLTITPD